MSDSGQNHEILTLVVRLWREAGAGDGSCWRGRIEHIGTQEVGYVEDVAGVSRLIERWTRPVEEGTQMSRCGLATVGDHGEPSGSGGSG